MKTRDHYTLTLRVCRILSLTDHDTCRRIAEASTLPDLQPDYILVCGRRRCWRRRVKHHDREGVELAVSKLLEARRLYLRRREGWTEELGKALHYIQDYVVSVESRVLRVFAYRDYDAHRRLEDEVSRMLREYSVDWLAPVASMRVYPHTLRRFLLEELRPRTNPKDILDDAAYATALALKCFFDPAVPEELLRGYWERVLLHWGKVVASAGLAWALLTKLIWLLPHEYMHLAPFLFAAWMLAPPTIAAVVHHSDKRYHDARFTRMWLKG